MKAVIKIPLNENETRNAIKALKDENNESERTKTTYKQESDGLEIVIEAQDSTGMRAAVNTALKLYKTHEETKKCLNYLKKQEKK